MNTCFRASASTTIVVSLLTLLGLSACDSTYTNTGLTVEEVETVIAEAVTDVRLSPFFEKSGEQKYVLKVTFDTSRKRIRFPDGIHILGRRETGSGVVIFDDGNGLDARPGDGVYSGVVDERCLPADSNDPGLAGKDVEIKCKIEFVGPGEKCGAFSECPETLHRSLLWGLIEYDVETLICFCLAECEVTKK